jgi:hypothetical protein
MRYPPMPTVPTTVWIDRDTAAIALTELQALGTETATETTAGDIEQAIDDLSGAVTTAAPRAHLARHGAIEECQIPGVLPGSVTIDYHNDSPRLLVHAEDTEEPTHIINLPSDDSTTYTAGSRPSETRSGQPADELPSVRTLIAQLRAGERELVADATVSTPETEFIELHHQASDGAVILQYDYGRAFRSDTDETFELLL